mmetsp:Transcript_1404/g.2116  ORF Transcript_1404/g.2116 Transcript_1404/m.2116 type:complete len:367 (-) Transcript_1404:54-1154(-)
MEPPPPDSVRNIFGTLFIKVLKVTLNDAFASVKHLLSKKEKDLPFVKISYCDVIRRTRPARNPHRPKWNQAFDFEVAGKSRKVLFEVFRDVLDVQPYATGRVDFESLLGVTDSNLAPYCIKLRRGDDSQSEFIGRLLVCMSFVQHDDDAFSGTRIATMEAMDHHGGSKYSTPETIDTFEEDDENQQEDEEDKWNNLLEEEKKKMDLETVDEEDEDADNAGRVSPLSEDNDEWRMRTIEEEEEELRKAMEEAEDEEGRKLGHGHSIRKVASKAAVSIRDAFVHVKESTNEQMRSTLEKWKKKGTIEVRQGAYHDKGSSLKKDKEHEGEDKDISEYAARFRKAMSSLGRLKLARDDMHRSETNTAISA